jgi:hypothetical protein
MVVHVSLVMDSSIPISAVSGRYDKASLGMLLGAIEDPPQFI